MNLNAAQDKDTLELIQKIRNDPWEFSKYVWTIDESDERHPKKKFPSHKLYIKLYFRLLQKENRIAVPKSRRMLMTWANVVFFLWDAMFHEGRHNAVVSKKEDDADWMLEKRFKYIYDNLDPAIPRDLLPKLHHKYCLLSFPEIDSRIQGFPQGEGQLRQYTCSNIFADEQGFWEKPEGTYKASLPTLLGGGRYVAVSSPAPGFFKRLVFDQMDATDVIGQKSKDIESSFPIEGVEIWRNKNNEFLVYQLHYTADPDKRSDSFKHRARKGMSEKDFLQEYELRWDSYVGHPVYPGFNKIVHGSQKVLKPHLGLPLLRGWDFGLTPACVIAQLQEDKLVVLKEFVAVNMGIEKFSEIVLSQLLLLYPTWADQKKDYFDFIDPSGMFRSDIDEGTCAMALAAKGLNPIPGDVTFTSRKEGVDFYLNGMTKGEPNFLINVTECPVLVRGFEGGYRYPEKVMSEQPTKIRPIKDEHSHPHDSLQMIASKIKIMTRRARRRVPSLKYNKAM